MGSVGKGQDSSNSAMGTQILNFPSRTNNTSNSGWDFRGIKEQLDKLTETLNKTKSGNKIASIYSSLGRLDNTISAELSDSDYGENERKTLMSLRRQVRQLRKRITLMD